MPISNKNSVRVEHPHGRGYVNRRKASPPGGVGTLPKGTGPKTAVPAEGDIAVAANRMSVEETAPSVVPPWALLSPVAKSPRFRVSSRPTVSRRSRTTRRSGSVGCFWPERVRGRSLWPDAARP